MEEKKLRLLILTCICVFMAAFGLLIYYYIDYSNKADERANQPIEGEIINQEVIDDKLSQEHSGSQNFGETDKTYESGDTVKDYYDYADDVLKLETSLTEDQTTKIFNDAVQKIRILALTRDFNGAAALASKTMTETVFPNGKEYSTMYSLSSISGFGTLEPFEQQVIIQNIKDPIVYMALFYAMKPEYQVLELGSENFLWLPVSEDNQITYLSIEDGGALESRANEYFSELTDCDIFKIKINVASTEYYVYVVGKENHSYRITNIESVETAIGNYVNYTDYFNVWGREEVEIYYD